MPKILVAEDEPALAQFYVALLSQWNCETVVERSGTDAVRRAATFRPDVALLGVVMPDIGGIETWNQAAGNLSRNEDRPRFRVSFCQNARAIGIAGLSFRDTSDAVFD